MQYSEKLRGYIEESWMGKSPFQERKQIEKRVVCGFDAKKSQPSKRANPHENWLFWRRVWDSNPRYREVHLISSQARYDHFDNSPCNFRPPQLSVFRDDP